MIEKRLGCGQVEELIEEARDELTLIGKMIGSCAFLIDALIFCCHADLVRETPMRVGRFSMALPTHLLVEIDCSTVR